MKFYGLIFTLFSTLFFSIHSNAEENIRWHQHGQKVSFVILHGEKDRFIVEEFEKTGESLQSRVRESIFANRENAVQRFNQVTQGFSSERPRSILKSMNTQNIIGEDIWTATQEWNVQWEQKFTQWLNENATPEFFFEHGIETDCADVPYAYRWIFARINSLPAASTLAGTKDLFHNGSMKPEWVALPKNANWDQDQRFLKALNFLLNNTYTHSLMEDVYPVAIHRNHFNGGAIHLNLYSEDSGHTEFISRVILDNKHPGPIQIIASTIPRELRLLSEYSFDYWGGGLVEGKHAFVKFLWVRVKADSWYFAAPKDIPGSSKEQFDPNFANGFQDEGEAIIHKLLPNWKPDPKAVLKTQVSKALQRLKERVPVVFNGLQYCTSHNDCHPGENGWEVWSTPSRDKAISRLVDSINVIYNQTLCDQPCMDELDNYRQREILTIDGTSYYFEDAINAWVNHSYSSDPKDAIAKRWGISSASNP